MWQEVHKKIIKCLHKNSYCVNKLTTLHQLELIILLEANKCLEENFKKPKAAKKSSHEENTSENEYQTDSNLSHESSSDD